MDKILNNGYRCSCNGMTEDAIVKVVQGNDVTLDIQLTKYDVDEEIWKSYSLVGKDDVQCYLLTPNGTHINLDTEVELDGKVKAKAESYQLETNMTYGIGVDWQDGGNDLSVKAKDIVQVIRYSEVNDEYNVEVDESATYISLGQLPEDYITPDELTVVLGDYVTNSSLSSTLEGYVEDSELDNYVTDSDLSTVLEDYVDETELSTSLQPYATISYVNEAISSIPGVDMSNYYNKTEIDTTLQSYATISYVNEAISSIPGADMSNYYTKSDIDTTLQSYVDETELSSTLSSYVTDNQLSSTLQSYATISYVNEAISSIPGTDLSNYYTKSDIDTTLTSYVTDSELNTTLQSYVTETELSTTLNPYITETELSTTLNPYITYSDLDTTLQSYIDETELSSTLSSYVSDNQLSSTLQSYATIAYVNEAIANIPGGGSGDVTMTYLDNYLEATATALTYHASDLYTLNRNFSNYYDKTASDLRYITSSQVASNYISNSTNDNQSYTIAAAFVDLDDRVTYIEQNGSGGGGGYVPTVNDATLTIQRNGTTLSYFTANAYSDVTCNITVPTDTNDLTNGANFVSSSYITEIVQISQNDYDALVSGGTVDSYTMYVIV